jgi:hypothetical protein
MRETKGSFAPMAGLQSGTLGHRGPSIGTRKRVLAAQGDASSPTTPLDWVRHRFQELVFSLQCMVIRSDVTFILSTLKEQASLYIWSAGYTLSRTRL